MKYSAIFLAITRGGVVVTKEVVVDLEEEAFMKHFEAFTKENSQHFCAFLTDREMRELTRRIEQKIAGRVIIG